MWRNLFVIASKCTLTLLKDGNEKYADIFPCIENSESFIMALPPIHKCASSNTLQ